MLTFFTTQQPQSTKGTTSSRDKTMKKVLFHSKQDDEGKVSASIVSIEPLTSDIKLVTMKVADGSSLHFSAGQFIGVQDGREDVPSSQASIFPGTYSIASPPSALPLIKFAIGKDQNPRNLRNRLYYHAKVGDPILLDSKGSGTVAITPRMVMTPVGGPGGLMLIGGGSAVMGLVSIVEELLSNENDREGLKIPAIKLFHSNRSNEDIPFYDRMQELERIHDTFHYFPHITGDVKEASGQTARGAKGRITPRDLANEIAGVRLFCVCGSGVFCEAVVNMLLKLGVWPGSIRTDYTTRVDPSRRGVKLVQKDQVDEEDVTESSDFTDSTASLTSSESDQDLRRFEACADATQEKGSMTSSSKYLKTYGVDVLLQTILKRMEQDKPDFPLEYLKNELDAAQQRLPEVSNINAGDPDFWINYWETDCVTWQAPVVSPWLDKYMDIGLFASRLARKQKQTKRRNVFVPLCGKSLDMKLLLDAGHHVVGADCSGIACTDFFSENNIPDYVREEVSHPNGKRVVRHKSTSLPIELYEGDIFDLTPEIVGPIDRILDRAALVALHPSMISGQYLPLLMSLLSPGGKMLFASVSELPFPKAPPHAYKQQQIEDVLKPFFSKIRLLETHRYRVNAGYVSEPIYMLTKSK